MKHDALSEIAVLSGLLESALSNIAVLENCGCDPQWDRVRQLARVGSRSVGELNGHLVGLLNKLGNEERARARLEVSGGQG